MTFIVWIDTPKQTLVCIDNADYILQMWPSWINKSCTFEWEKTTTFHLNRKWLLTPHNIRTFLSPPWIVAPRAFKVCLRNSGWPGHAAPVTRLPSVKQAEMGLGSFQIPPVQKKEFVKSQNKNVQHFHGHSLWKVTFSKAVQWYWWRLLCLGIKDFFELRCPSKISIWAAWEVREMLFYNLNLVTIPMLPYTPSDSCNPIV